MSVWPLTPAAALSGSGGVLVSISISVDPRYLESLLETLARVSFPVNPQIYHDAALVYVYPDQHEETEPVTLVEFPAYTGQLDEVLKALEAYGFDPAILHVTSMLDELLAPEAVEPAPSGARYVARYRRKSRSAGAGGGYSQP
ncbi:MAG: hypothetical protein LAP40_21070 [Acidobacteriia bacterium]|nr:hypothetical protein [Terriglobia bacterium]